MKPFWKLLLLALLLGIVVRTSFAHEQPTTLALLDVAPEKVAMTLHVPLNELELAFGHGVTIKPEDSLKNWQASFTDYLLQHIKITANDHQPWVVSVGAMTIADAMQTQSGAFQEIIVQLMLTPPAGVSTRKFTLHYDLIMHQVVTHKALLSIRNDWESGKTEAQPSEPDVIKVNTQTAKVNPVEIDLEQGSWWSGFKGMMLLGMQHIKEGTDHLLFLLVLLLPAPLLVQGRAWGKFGGGVYSIKRLLKIVTAFTVGHSLTLLAGALGWLHLPSQPVEILVAASILISAVHAVRPFFAGKEIFVAAGFGLVHGLAFATVLSNLNLDAVALAISILGFNLGIECMQLFIIAITIPWLIVLSLTPAYQPVRIVSAMAAAVAAMGWIVQRISQSPNVIDSALQNVNQYAPLGILLLALLAIPTYFWTTTRVNKISSAPEK